MTAPDDDAPETAWSGKFLAVKRRGRWEYATRTRDVRAAVILAIDSDAAGEHVVLVEQYRVPLGRRCLELPAGLVGDEEAGESAATSAARELAEETGYRAARWRDLGSYYSSPGMVDECFTLFRADDLVRIGAGGGVADEDIAVHRVAIDAIADFVRDRRDAGVAIDVKLLLLLGAGLLDQRKLSA